MITVGTQEGTAYKKGHFESGEIKASNQTL